MSDFVVRQAAPGDAAALTELGREVSSEPEAWLITEGEWRSVGDERRDRFRAARAPARPEPIE